MPQFGINFREFFSRYFADHDDTFLSNLGEMISEDADPREIAALADWHFRNYIIEAVTIAMQLNNEKIYNDVMAMLEERDYNLRADSGRERVSRSPEFRETAGYRAPEEPETGGMPYTPTHMDKPPRPYQDLPVMGGTQGKRLDDPSSLMGFGPQRGFESHQQGRGRQSEYDEMPSYGGVPDVRGLRDMRKMADSGGFSEPASDLDGEEPAQPEDINFNG